MSITDDRRRPATGDRSRYPALAPMGAPIAPAKVRSARRLRRGWLMRRLLLAADVLGLLLAFALVALTIGSVGEPDPLPLYLETLCFALLLPGWVVGLWLFGLYDRDEERADHSTADDLPRVFLLVTTGAWLLTLIADLTNVLAPDMLKVGAFWAGAVVFITALRRAARAAARRLRAFRQPTLIVGGGEVGQIVARKLGMHPEYGVDVVGIVDANPRPTPTWRRAAPVLGSLGDLDALVVEHDVERVVFAYSEDSHRDLIDAIRRLRDAGVQVDVVPRFFEVIGPKADVHSIEGMAVIGLPAVRLSRTTALGKRVVDLVGASCLIVLTAPLFAVLALLIRRSSPGPVFFRQQRLGKDMKPFTVLKFRTMRDDTDDAPHREYIAASMRPDAPLVDGTRFKLSRDDAVTGIGRWLRRTSLDELPQIVNVLKGEMSLVGPRPCLEWETEHFEPHHFERFLVPAGLTGLWQVSARAQATYGEALDLDVLYAHSASVGLDLRLLLRTPLQLLRSNATA